MTAINATSPETKTSGKSGASIALFTGRSIDQSISHVCMCMLLRAYETTWVQILKRIQLMHVVFIWRHKESCKR